MVVHNFDAASISAAPQKADTPLVVDPYAVLPAPVAAERLQPIRGWGFQIFEFGGGLNHSQFSARYSLDVAEPSAVMAQADLFSFLAAKRLYHRLLYRTSCNVKQYSAKIRKVGCRYAANSALDRGGSDGKRRSQGGASAGIIEVKGETPRAIGSFLSRKRTADTWPPCRRCRAVYPKATLATRS
jgi:hypothetical protein